VTATYQMRVTNPGGTGGLGLCESCSADVQCGGAGDNCVRVGQTDSCLKACNGTAGECPSGYTCSAAAGGVGRRRQRAPVHPHRRHVLGGPHLHRRHLRGQRHPGPGQLANLPDLDPDTYDFTSCPLPDGSNDDEDWFPIILTADATVTFMLERAWRVGSRSRALRLDRRAPGVGHRADARWRP
jgi:hypothetical protein